MPSIVYLFKLKRRVWRPLCVCLSGNVCMFCRRPCGDRPHHHDVSLEEESFFCKGLSIKGIVFWCTSVRHQGIELYPVTMSTRRTTGDRRAHTHTHTHTRTVYRGYYCKDDNNNFLLLVFWSVKFCLSLYLNKVISCLWGCVESMSHCIQREKEREREREREREFGGDVTTWKTKHKLQSTSSNNPVTRHSCASILKYIRYQGSNYEHQPAPSETP